MNSVEFDIYSLISKGDDVQYFKALTERIFVLRQQLKQQLDAGVAPDEFQAAQAQLQALDTAAAICEALQA